MTATQTRIIDQPPATRIAHYKSVLVKLQNEWNETYTLSTDYSLSESARRDHREYLDVIDQNTALFQKRIKLAQAELDGTLE